MQHIVPRPKTPIGDSSWWRLTELRRRALEAATSTNDLIDCTISKKTLRKNVHSSLVARFVLGASLRREFDVWVWSAGSMLKFEVGVWSVNLKREFEARGVSLKRLFEGPKCHSIEFNAESSVWMSLNLIESHWIPLYPVGFRSILKSRRHRSPHANLVVLKALRRLWSLIADSNCDLCCDL